MLMSFEYKLEPTAEQSNTLTEWLETARRVWNYALAERKDWLNSRKSPVNACSMGSEFIIPADAPWPTYARQCKALTHAKQTNPWLKTVNAQALQQVLQQLEKAFISMRERGLGFPRFKKSGRFRSICFPQFSSSPVRGEALRLPTIGYIKMRLSRPIPDGFQVKQVRVLKRASGWYAVLAMHSDVELPEVHPHGEAIGIDLGLTQFAAVSDGEVMARPRFFVDAQRKLKLLQQRVARKARGSSNRRKAQHKVALLHEQIANSRRDFHRKVAHHLCDKARVVFAEDLGCKALAASMLAKHTLDAGWGGFLSTLEWVCRKRGVYFRRVDARGASQTCPECASHTGKKELSQRMHECPECGYTTDRDVAAAQVVRNRGLAAVGQTVKKLVEGNAIGHPMKQEGISFL
ncbi:MAG: transposase [Gemmatimonadaceae bacterium]|nr:transposase [Gloeobacterales cyanobacterium ES-bin-141]